MNMQQIQIFCLGHLGHFRSERERVRLMFKQRIGHHLHFVETNAIIELGQPCGEGGCDEMDCVTALGELLPEFGSHDAAAAICRINRDADVHERLWSSVFGLVALAYRIVYSSRKIKDRRPKTKDLKSRGRRPSQSPASISTWLTLVCKGGQVRA